MASCNLTIGGLILQDKPLLLSRHDDRESTTPRRSTPIEVPGLSGSIYGELVGQERTERYVLVVSGETDVAGTPAIDHHLQMLANVRAVRTAIRQQFDADTAATFTVDEMTYQADVHAALAGSETSDEHYHGDLLVTVPSGMWQATDPTVSTSPSSSATRVLASAAGGSLDLYDAVITLTGAATTVRLVQGDRWLQFAGSLGGGVTLDCGTLDATRDGDPVHGLVTRDGGRGWMPVSADGSDITIIPTGGAVAVSVSVSPAW